MIHLPPAPEGWMMGHRVLIPRHVQALDRSSRQIWCRERKISLVESPHWDGPGTNFQGLEVLASMSVAGAVSGPAVAPGTSMLTRECLESIAPSYFKLAGSRLWVRAYGTILGTTVITTQQIALNVGPTYASPLGGQMIGQLVAALTPGVTAVVADWFLDAMVTVRATGNVGSLICAGVCINNIVANATFVPTPFKSTALGTAAAPVVLTTPGLLQPLFFDLISIQGAATAGNSATCLDYQLASLN